MTAAQDQEDDAGKQAKDGGLDRALGAEVAADEQVRAVEAGGEQAVVHGVAVDGGSVEGGIGEVPGEVDGNGRPEASGIDIRRAKQDGMGGNADNADNRGIGDGDMDGEEEHCEDKEGEPAAEPLFCQAEEDADDERFGDDGIDEGIPEVRQEGQERADSGDSKDMGEVLEEDDDGCQSGAEEDAAGEVAQAVAGGEFGDCSFFIALIEGDIDGADEDGEDGAGDGVPVGLGEGGVG